MNELEKYYNEIFNISGKIATAFSILPLLVAYICRKNLNKTMKAFLWYLLIRFSLNVLTELFIWSANKHYKVFWKPILQPLKIENTFFFNGFFTLNVYISLGLFYYLLFKKEKIGQIIKYSAIFLFFFQIINYLFIDGFRDFGLVGPTVASSFMIFLPCYYLWYISNQPTELPISKNSYFWISIAVSIPHLITLLFMVIANKIYTENFILYCKIHIGRNFIEILSQFIFAYAFTKAKYLKYLD